MDDELRDVQEALDQYRILVGSPIWKLLMQIADEQVHIRVQGILLTPLESLDGALPQEYEKGFTAGIKLFQNMAHLEIERLTEITENAARKDTDTD